jgi:glycosyltransferase involved in cell wall biosynthesis
MSDDVGCSVVIPTYNRVQLVPRAIRSILAQTHKNWELLVVDDGSSDGTADVVEAFVSKQVRLIRKSSNTGAGDSRNIGVRQARFPFITFLDSDDEAVPDWLAKMLDGIVRAEAGAVCCGLSEFDAYGKLLAVKLPSDMGALFDHQRGAFTRGSDYLLKRELFDAVGGFDTTLRSGQHTELAMRLIPHLRGQRLSVVTIQESLIRVHIHRGPRIRTNWEAMFDGHASVVRKHRDLFAKDKRLLANYLSIAAVCGIRVGRVREGRRFFEEALRADPRRAVLWMRWFVAQVPGVRSWVWRP